MTVMVRRLCDDDAEVIAALTARYFAPDPAWSPDVARQQLAADAFEGGARVIVAERDDRVVGFGGSVAAPPWLYLWPVVGDDEAAAGAVLDGLLAAGRRPGLARARVSVRRGEPGKQAAVLARGFVRSIDFLELVRSPAVAAPRSAAPRPVADLEPRQGPAIDRAAMHATHDLSFAEIANTGPTTADDFAALLDGPSAWPAATAAWFAADGTCAGFVIGLRHADHGVVEAIGVASAWRRRGLAAAMLDHLLTAAASAGLPEVRALIASDNAGSLALHHAAGFVERERKALWDLALAAAP